MALALSKHLQNLSRYDFMSNPEIDQIEQPKQMLVSRVIWTGYVLIVGTTTLLKFPRLLASFCFKSKTISPLVSTLELVLQTPPGRASGLLR